MLHETHETSASQWICRALARDIRKANSYQLTTADTDDRVVPGHSFKFAARLQECHAGDAPVLIRIETAAGHGAGKPVSKAIDETADMWAFLVKVLKMKPPAR